MISAFNAILECMVTGLFTAGFMLLFMRQGWFPVIIVKTMTQEEYDKSLEDEDE